MIIPLQSAYRRVLTILTFIKNNPVILAYIGIVELCRVVTISFLSLQFTFAPIITDILFLWMGVALLYHTETVLQNRPGSLISSLLYPIKRIQHILIWGFIIGFVTGLSDYFLSGLYSWTTQEALRLALIALEALILASITTIITFERTDPLKTIVRAFGILTWRPIALFMSYGLLFIAFYIAILSILFLTFCILGLLGSLDLLNASWFNTITLLFTTSITTIFQTAIILLCFSFYKDKRSLEQEEMMIDVRATWIE